MWNHKFTEVCKSIAEDNNNHINGLVYTVLYLSSVSVGFFLLATLYNSFEILYLEKLW